MNAEITRLFPEVKPLRTYAGAQARLDRALGACEAKPLAFVVAVEKGFLPVVVVGDRTTWMAAGLAAQGICVTNVR